MELTKIQTAKVKQLFPKHWKKVINNMDGKFPKDNSASEFLLEAFVWCGTKEGANYWVNIHNQIIDKEPNQ